ncbi:MAG TPA: hypothetical protein VLM42_20500, partial [Bryobacteraceae bacterium]|nr:hypothetical protein [Bryobacteraceae bacterium]
MLLRIAAIPFGFTFLLVAALGQSNSGKEWLTYGRDAGETRYSPLNQINPSNVSRLGLAWSYELGAGGGN